MNLNSADSLEKLLELNLNDISLLQQALTHSSAINEDGLNAKCDNERLEFLGDAVIDLVVSQYLYLSNPEFSEGELTTLRSQVVSGEALFKVASKLHIGEYLVLGKGEEISGGRSKKSNLAGVLEAIIGAIFIDQGWDIARTATLNILTESLELSITSKQAEHPKSKLQIFSQAKFGKIPEYFLMSKRGLDHDPVFEVEVRLPNGLIGVGKGNNKGTAENEAAINVLTKMD